MNNTQYKILEFVVVNPRCTTQQISDATGYDLSTTMDALSWLKITLYISAIVRRNSTEWMARENGKQFVSEME